MKELTGIDYWKAREDDDFRKFKNGVKFVHLVHKGFTDIVTVHHIRYSEKNIAINGEIQIERVEYGINILYSPNYPLIIVSGIFAREDNEAIYLSCGYASEALRIRKEGRPQFSEEAYGHLLDILKTSVLFTQYYDGET